MRGRRKGESGGALAWWVRSGGERVGAGEEEARAAGGEGAVGGFLVYPGVRRRSDAASAGGCGERAGAVIALCSHCRVLSLLQAVGGASLLLSGAGAGSGCARVGFLLPAG